MEIVTSKRQEELLSLTIEEILKYFVRIPNSYTNYLLTTDFRNDKKWIEQFFNYLDEEIEKQILPQNENIEKSLKILKEIVWCYMFYRLNGDDCKSERFMFIIICIIDPARSPL